MTLKMSNLHLPFISIAIFYFFHVLFFFLILFLFFRSRGEVVHSNSQENVQQYVFD